MTKQLLVLSCSQVKRVSECALPAIDVYNGPAYQVLRKYLREHDWPDDLSVGILSAEYGLLGGLAPIEQYDRRMTQDRAKALRSKCQETLSYWAKRHSRVHLSLGKDYLPAILENNDHELEEKISVHTGPIGVKLSKIRSFLSARSSSIRLKPNLEPGKNKLTYFLPDWEDHLDPKFDFKNDNFSSKDPDARGDLHCCKLMHPDRMCDGILISLAQSSKRIGPWRPKGELKEELLSPSPLRKHYGLSADQWLFGDCGAFSYSNSDQPPLNVEQAVSLYGIHGFDYGTSVDHIPVTKVTLANNSVRALTMPEREERVSITTRNAEDFYAIANSRSAPFIPVGAIQALSPEEYASKVRHYCEVGYRHIAIGGLVPLKDSHLILIVRAVAEAARNERTRPWIHLFGVYRPKLQAEFRSLGIDSFDSASYFRKSWLRSSQNYLGVDGKWYSALRVPMMSDGRTRKKLESSGIDPIKLQEEESHVLSLLTDFDYGTVSKESMLDALLSYDAHLQRTSDLASLRNSYAEVLTTKPWRKCGCPFCKNLGVHIMVFRGYNRNKRRGSHNTLMLYKSLHK